MHFDGHFVRGALAQVDIIGTLPTEISFSVDTRLLQPGDIFVALQGARVDGHEFIAEALERGAVGIMIAQEKKDVVAALLTKLHKKCVCIVVPDTLEALVRLAQVWRVQFDYPIIAITGSVGKTSTKELVAQILTMHGNNCLVSQGNQNTKIGISLNILRMRPEHTVAVFEVGINKRGEMAQLAQLLRPTTGIITSIGHCHMEGLGSLHDIALEKRDLFKYFNHDSIGIINGDQSLLAQVSYAHPVIKFGAKTINQIQARKIHTTNKSISFFLKIYKEKYTVVLPQVHEGAVFNSLAAAAVAHLLKVPGPSIVKAIEKTVVVPGRFEQRLLRNKKGTLINDCYNANPESMKAALLAFQQIETKSPKIAILGDMLGLGVNSPFWHRQVGRFLRKVPSLNKVILVGNLVAWVKKTAPVGLRVEVVASWQDAVRKIEGELDAKPTILVKGSRAIGLEHLVSQLTNK